MLVFDLDRCWQYKDSSIVEKIKEFAEKNELKEVVLSTRVLVNLVSRFSCEYPATLYDYINKEVIPLKGEKDEDKAI